MINEKDNQIDDEYEKYMRNGYNFLIFLIVNITVFVGFNLIWFLLFGKGLYDAWGGVFYILYGAPILFIIELICNIYLCIKKKANFLIALVVVITSIIYFNVVSGILEDSNTMRIFMLGR